MVLSSRSRTLIYWASMRPSTRRSTVFAGRSTCTSLAARSRDRARARVHALELRHRAQRQRRLRRRPMLPSQPLSLRQPQTRCKPPPRPYRRRSRPSTRAHGRESGQGSPGRRCNRATGSSRRSLPMARRRSHRRHHGQPPRRPTARARPPPLRRLAGRPRPRFARECNLSLVQRCYRQGHRRGGRLVAGGAGRQRMR